MDVSDRAKVLLVDDEEASLVLLETILEPLGETLVRARSGAEALEALAADTFAVVLLDVRMPGLDGFETAMRIRARDETRHLPIIFLTGSTDLQEVLRGYSTGAADFILKPFEPEVLQSKVAVFVNLYRLQREAELLTHRALHDDLTGLPNRNLFRDRLAMALARMTRTRSPIAVFFLDLDGFKSINDSLGHEAGDRVLVEVANRLRGCVRPSDTVARFAGDEFTIVCESIASEEEARQVARRLASELAAPVQLAEREVAVSASIGITLVGDPAAAPEALLREADAAMYRAKEAGPSRYALFGDSMRAGIASRVRRERALRRAVERGEFCLMYQPLVRLADAELLGVEALLRWDDPDRGLIPPSEFVDLAEESGLIWELGLWVLKQACRQARRWREAVPDARPVTLSVNLSPRQLEHEGLVGEIERLLVETSTDPATLCLEITEGALIGKAGLALRTLLELSRLGVTLAVDDFGTGHASISRLRELPVDVLKIDRTFVAGLARDRQSVELAAAIVALARALGVTAIAEGVESVEQLAALHALGYDGAQGFFLASPQSPHAIELMLRRLAARRLPFLPEAALTGAPRARPVVPRRQVRSAEVAAAVS
jgi:diguanylate cyclase (GGDEF)-like protein